MNRRQVLRLLTTTAAISTLPLEALSLLRDTNAQATQTGSLSTLSAHQNATVVALGELIIPATDTPGAKAVKVNEFIDLLLTEWFEPIEVRQFLQGLADVDLRSNAKFERAFVECTNQQQGTLVEELDSAAMQFAALQKQTTESDDTPPQKDFFYQFKKLTLAGYYTSEIGFTQELGRSIIPPHAGCVPVSEVTR